MTASACADCCEARHQFAQKPTTLCDKSPLLCLMCQPRAVVVTCSHTHSHNCTIHPHVNYLRRVHACMQLVALVRDAPSLQNLFKIALERQGQMLISVRPPLLLYSIQSFLRQHITSGMSTCMHAC